MDNINKSWYAIYVKSRAEKKVALELEYNNIDYYLPLIKRLKQWSDRRKWVEGPLFNSYIFVHINKDEYYKTLNTLGVVKYITFDGTAVSIPEQQIMAIKLYLEDKDPDNINESDWTPGRKVEIISGSLSGLQGELIEINGKSKVKVEIEAVNESLVIQIPRNKLLFI
ncbi:MAG: UpxY family transcription antiterminator [Bacteroidales bacterium]|nr:UpxY family transcription antiterminator [Bacteroidales bacterium]